MNHTVAHMAGAGFLLLLAAGCNRPAPGLNDSETAMNGYRIEGKLIDEFLRPLVGVQVLLYYDLSFISADSTSRAYTPSSQGEVVTIEVKDRAGQTVRTLFSGPAPQDSLVVVSWNERDDNGDIVRSGLYTVTYTVAGVVRQSYRLIIDGNQNSVTDTEGRFVIPESDLPVDEIAPYYDSSDAFVGEFQIRNEVFLRFVAPSFARTFRVALVKNKITNFVVVLN